MDPSLVGGVDDTTPGLVEIEKLHGHHGPWRTCPPRQGWRKMFHRGCINRVEIADYLRPCVPLFRDGMERDGVIVRTIS